MTSDIRSAIDYAITALRAAIDAETGESTEPPTHGNTIAAMGIALGVLLTIPGYIDSTDNDEPEQQLTSEVMSDTWDWEALGHAVRARRNWLGISQSEIGRRGGPSDQTVSRIEQNRRVKYNAPILIGLEKALRWPPKTIESILLREISDGDRKTIITVPDQPETRKETPR
jgi:DNA-binding XRE family transcriptional regulator